MKTPKILKSAIKGLKLRETPGFVAHSSPRGVRLTTKERGATPKGDRVVRMEPDRHHEQPRIRWDLRAGTGRRMFPITA